MIQCHDEFRSDNYFLYSNGTDSIDASKVDSSAWFLKLCELTEKYTATFLFKEGKCYCTIELAYGNIKPSIWKKGYKKRQLQTLLPILLY